MNLTRTLFHLHRLPSKTLILNTSTQHPRLFSSAAAAMGRVSKAVEQDHREIETYYNNMLQASTIDDKTRWQNQFTWELARHSVGEELVIYPAMEKHLPNGKEMADKDRADHQKVKEQLYEFQSLHASDVKFEPTIRHLMKNLSEHIKEEEEDHMPVLEKALTEEESEKLHKSFQRSKMFAPTRSHPNAPDKPPFETVAGLIAAPLDKLRDMFNKFPDPKDV
jgi:hemerythrin superfamily protein